LKAAFIENSGHQIRQTPGRQGLDALLAEDVVFHFAGGSHPENRQEKSPGCYLDGGEQRAEAPGHFQLFCVKLEQGNHAVAGVSRTLDRTASRSNGSGYDRMEHEGSRSFDF